MNYAFVLIVNSLAVIFTSEEKILKYETVWIILYLLQIDAKYFTYMVNLVA